MVRSCGSTNGTSTTSSLPNVRVAPVSESMPSKVARSPSALDSRIRAPSPSPVDDRLTTPSRCTAVRVSNREAAAAALLVSATSRVPSSSTTFRNKRTSRSGNRRRRSALDHAFVVRLQDFSRDCARLPGGRGVEIARHETSIDLPRRPPLSTVPIVGNRILAVPAGDHSLPDRARDSGSGGARREAVGPARLILSAPISADSRRVATRRRRTTDPGRRSRSVRRSGLALGGRLFPNSWGPATTSGRGSRR